MNEEQVRPDQPVTERGEMGSNHNHGTLLAGGSITNARLRTEDCDCARPMAEREIDAPIGNANQMREFRVKQLNYGYIVTIGCHSFAIETAERLAEKLTEYIKDPQGTEKKWFNGQLF